MGCHADESPTFRCRFAAARSSVELVRFGNLARWKGHTNKRFTSEKVALEWIAKASATWVSNLPRRNRNYGPRTRANHAAKKDRK
jgi:hypothetical protein